MSGLMDVFGGDAVTKTDPDRWVKAPAITHTEGAEKPQETPGSFFGDDHAPELEKAIKEATKASDAARAAKAALDYEKGELTAKLDKKIAPLKEAWKTAETARKEAEEALLRVMQAEKVSKIPMDDRPEIKIKVTPGKKKPITRKWLADPEGVVVKTFGAKAPGVIWDAVPKSDGKTEVVVPPPYEDEPRG